MYIVIIILVAFVVLFWFFINPYMIKHDNVTLITGAPGTGKDVTLVPLALKQYKNNLRHFYVRSYIGKVLPLKRFKDLEKPILMSNLPICTKGFFKIRDLSYRLTKDVVLLNARVPMGSVLYISEFGSFASQFDFDNPNALYNLDEFMRFIRQYLKGGYLFLNDQSSDNVLLQVRRRVGTLYNCLEFHKFGIIHWNKIRKITISEDIKSIETGNSEDRDNTSNHFGVFNPFRPLYDKWAFSERYATVPKREFKKFESMKVNELLTLPVWERRKVPQALDKNHVKVNCLTTDSELRLKKVKSLDKFKKKRKLFKKH